VHHTIGYCSNQNCDTLWSREEIIILQTPGHQSCGAVRGKLWHAYKTDPLDQLFGMPGEKSYMMDDRIDDIAQ